MQQRQVYVNKENPFIESYAGRRIRSKRMLAKGEGRQSYLDILSLKDVVFTAVIDQSKIWYKQKGSNFLRPRGYMLKLSPFETCWRAVDGT